MKTKKFFAAQVLSSIANDFPNIDVKVEEREIFILMDAVVNELAAKNYFENWKFGGYGVDEQFITTWEDVTVVDQENGLPSYFIFPANYVGLPRNGGISEIYPMKWISEDQPPVVVISHEDYRRYRSNPAGNMQGRLYGYPQGNRFYFATTCQVKKDFGNMGVRLVIRDSTQIANDQPYGIPADKENMVIATCVAWYRAKREEPTDAVRDNKDITAAAPR
jgi:hypothetical protein